MDIRRKILLGSLLASTFAVGAYVFFAWPRGNSFSTNTVTNPLAPSTQPIASSTANNTSEQQINAGGGSEAEIRGAFEMFIHRTAPVQNDDPEFFTASKSDASIVPLNAFTESIGMHINPKIVEQLDQRGYEIATCKAGGNAKAVFIGNIQPDNFDVNLYPNTVQYMKEWEPTMVRDLGAFLFPDVDQSILQKMNPAVVFKDDSYDRYAPVRLPDSKESQLYYSLADSSAFIIGTDADCVRKIAGILNGDE